MERAWAAAEAQGWVETVHPSKEGACRPGYQPSDWPRLTGNGHLQVEEVRNLRNDPRVRATACREVLLLWLATDGRGAVSADLLVTQNVSRFYDSPFTVDEVNEAGKFLVGTGLVRAVGVLGPDIVRPVLTTEGQQCVDFFDANVRDFLNPQQNGGQVIYNQNFHGPVNGQVAQDETVSMTQDQGIDVESLAAIFKAMRAALLSIEDVNDREDVTDAIRDLEVAVESQDSEAITKQAGRLKRLAGRIGSTAVTTATALGTTEMLQTLELG